MFVGARGLWFVPMSFVPVVEVAVARLTALGRSHGLGFAKLGGRLVQRVRICHLPSLYEIGAKINGALIVSQEVTPIISRDITRM